MCSVSTSASARGLAQVAEGRDAQVREVEKEQVQEVEHVLEEEHVLEVEHESNGVKGKRGKSRHASEAS